MRSAPAAVNRGRGRPPVHTRADILAAAKLAFSKSGYANVSLDMLAARLRTKKGSLYYHSSRKVDLLIQITRTLIGRTSADVRRISSMDAPPEQRFVWALRAHINQLLNDIQASKIYFENESDLPARARNEARSVLKEIQNTYIRLIAEGRKAGVFRVGQIDLAVMHIMAVANWPYRWFSKDGRLNNDKFVDNVLEFVLSAICCPGTDIGKLIKSRCPDADRVARRRREP